MQNNKFSKIKNKMRDRFKKRLKILLISSVTIVSLLFLYEQIENLTKYIIMK